MNLPGSRTALLSFFLGVGLALATAGSCHAALPANRDAASDSMMIDELPESVPTALLIAGALVEGGDYDGALRHYRYALERDPGNEEIGGRYIGLALQLGRIGEALSAVEFMLEHSPENPRLQLERCRLLLVSGMLDEADEFSAQLYGERPDDPQVLGLRIQILERKGDLKGASDLHAQQLAAHPDDPDLLRAHAALLFRAGSMDEGEAILRERLAEDPLDHGSAEMMIAYLLSEDRREEALGFAEARVEDWPDEEFPQRQLADLYLEEGRENDACNLLLPLARDGRLEHPAAIMLTDLLVRQGRIEEAWELASGFLESGEEDAMVLQMVGEIAMEQDHLEEAVEALERALRMRPQDPDVLVSLLLAMSRRYPELVGAPAADPRQGEAAVDDQIRERYNRLLVVAQDRIGEDSFRQNLILGAMLRRAKRSEEAVIPLLRASQLRPDNTQALYDLAWAQEEAGFYEEACDTLDRLLVLQPEEAHLLNFYGYLLADQNRELERAAEMIQLAVEAEPENPYYLDSLGWVLYRQGEYEEALEYLIDASNKLGDDPTILLHIGDTLLALERWDTALGVLQRALAVGGDAEELRERIERAEEGVRNAPGDWSSGRGAPLPGRLWFLVLDPYRCVPSSPTGPARRGGRGLLLAPGRRTEGSGPGPGARGLLRGLDPQ